MGYKTPHGRVLQFHTIWEVVMSDKEIEKAVRDHSNWALWKLMEILSKVRMEEVSK